MSENMNILTTEAVTLAIAFWGAITGTVAIVWEFLKWQLDTPKLRVTASPNMQIGEGAFIRPEQYISVNVTNVGRQPTKITHLVGCNFPSFFHRLFGRERILFIVPWHEHAQLPVMLNSADQWVGLISQPSTISAMDDKDVLYCGVVDTIGRRPILARIERRDFGNTKESD